MIDIQLIRDDPEKVKKGVTDKKFDPALVDKARELDEKKRMLIQEVEKLRAERNKTAKEASPSASPSPSPSEELHKKGKEIKDALQDKESELSKVEKEFEEVFEKVPNLPADDVPFGKDESENKVLRTWGSPKEFPFKPKDHLELSEALDIIDVERASEVSGSRFGYLKGDAVLLQFALIQFTLSVLTNRAEVGEIAKSVNNHFDNPFIPILPPVIVKSDVMKKMDRFDPVDDRYYLEQDDSLLIGSAEHTLGPLHLNETLAQKNLPIRYLGYSTSFRREAGTYGKDTRGIFRVHQFDKLEMESFSLPEYGGSEQNLMVAIQEYLVQQLGIPYQVMIMCTGDMGKPDHRQIDLNMWLPGQDQYRETHTSDYMTDYQARRLNTKVRVKDGNEFLHMNDATAFAMGRTLIAILENYQEEDGSVTIPEVLRKWMGKDKITKSNT